jgi:ankyrin repeat protein
VKEGADVNKKDNLGMTPLWKALRGGHDAAAQILVNNGAKPLLKEAGTEMCKAAASRDMQYVERLVKAGVDPNVVDYSQRTPLHVVAAQGTAEAVKFLVQEGADVFARDRLVLYTETQRERETHTHTVFAQLLMQ